MNTFDYKKVKDPQYFRDARMDAHSDHIYYRTKEEAEEKQSSYRVSLNGLWKFHYAKNYADVVAGFEKEDYCCSKYHPQINRTCLWCCICPVSVF